MLNKFILLISMIFFYALLYGPAYCASPDIAIVNKSARGKVLSVRPPNDISLYELITKSGYSIADEDVASFLTDFTKLNEDIKSISNIKKGTTVRLPLQNLKKTGNELASSGETSGLHAVKRRIVKKKEQKKFEAETNLANKEMLLRNIKILSRYLYDNSTVGAEGLKFFSVNEKTEIALDTSYFPVIELNTKRVLIVDYTGILPEEIGNIVELTWPEYRIVSFKPQATFKQIIGSLLESMGYAVNEARTVVAGGRTKIEYNADFIIFKKTSDILDSKIWIVGIVDNDGYSTPESLMGWFSMRDINLIELSHNETRNRHAAGADASYIDSDGNARVFAEAVLSRLGYKYSSNTSHNLSDRKEFTYRLKADLSINLGYRTKVFEFTELSDDEINFAKKKGIDIACIKPLEERRAVLSKILSLLSLHYSGSTASVSSSITPKGVKYRLLSPGFFVHSIHGPIFFTDSDLEPALLREIITDQISVIKF